MRASAARENCRKLYGTRRGSAGTLHVFRPPGAGVGGGDEWDKAMERWRGWRG